MDIFDVRDIEIGSVDGSYEANDSTLSFITQKYYVKFVTRISF